VYGFLDRSFGNRKIYYKENGKVSSFTLNYGNGTCDNLVSITENGKTTIVDFGIIFSNIADATIASPGIRVAKVKRNSSVFNKHKKTVIMRI
jgi:hypothetical protein